MHLLIRSLFSVVLLSALLAFTGCGGGSSNSGGVIDDTSGDSPAPVKVVINVTADAGEDKSVLTASSVTLDAGGSKNDNNASSGLEYYWELTSSPAGSSATLSDDSSIAPRLTVDVDGRYEIGLTVTYGDDTATDSVVITATTENIAPVADAGEDQYVSKDTNVALDGSASSDPNSDRLTYHWRLISIPDGSSATLSDTSSVIPSFTADRDGTYLARLIINDGRLDSEGDTVRVITSSVNSSPVARAGEDQEQSTGTSITLDGSKSSDADTDNMTFRWSFTSRPAGSDARLSNPTAIKPTFTADKDGTYRVSLVVNDGTVDSIADTVNITTSTANVAPKADAGDTKSYMPGMEITLDGSNSSDADSDSLTYKWSIVSGPSTSLANNMTSNPTFTAHSQGTYVFSLVVNDGKIDSKSDTVSINVSLAGSAPVLVGYIDYDTSHTYIIGETLYLEVLSPLFIPSNAEYFWSTAVKPAASTARILNSHGHTIQADFTPDVPGDYLIVVYANVGTVSTNKVSKTITIKSPVNQPPVANAGSDHQGVYDDDAWVYDSGSYDPDGDELTYKWRLVSAPNWDGSTLLLFGNHHEAMIGTFDAGDYVVELIVNDGTVDSAPDHVTITQLEDYH